MSTILKDSEIPLYMQVSEWIRENIYKGSWAKAIVFLLRTRLWKYCRSAEGTVKKAVTMLVNEGLLVQVQGRGHL
jgi:DNA-binding GntR family transcriptional regulator